MHDWREKRDWLTQFQPGDIVVFFDRDDNPHFQYSLAARFLRGIQSFSEEGDHTVVHVGLIHSPSPATTKPGETDMLIIDSMPGSKEDGGVAIRPLVRNYAIKVYRIKSNIPGVDAALLAKTALSIAEKFIGMSYSYGHCKDTLLYSVNREKAELNEQYTKWLWERHTVDFKKDDPLEPDTIDDGVNCSEFVITCYQLAYLQLSQAAARNEILPEFIGLHAHTSPAKLHKFFLESGFYNEIGAEPTRALRYSGLPHPEDNSMAIIPYVPPPELPPQPPAQSWSSWLWSYVPPAPDLSYAWQLLRLFPTLAQNTEASPVELTTAVKHTLQFDEVIAEKTPVAQELADNQQEKDKNNNQSTL